MSTTSPPAAAPSATSPAHRDLPLWQRLGLLLAVGVGAGALTSLGQGHLPHELHDVANSSTSWSVVAFALALPARRWWTAAAYAVAAFVLLLLGYELASQVRVGHGMAATTWLSWLLQAAVAGPVLGVAAWWARRDPRQGGCFAVGVVGGLAVAEGIYGLTVIAWSTSPVWWSISLGLGVAAIVGQLVRVRSARLTVLTLVLTAAVVGAFFTVYLGMPAFEVQ